MTLIMKHIVWLNLAWQWRYLTDKTGFLFIGTHCTTKCNVLICFQFFSKNCAVSAGTSKKDAEKVEQIIKAIPSIQYICLDVANGYSEAFVQCVKEFRQKFPEQTIMVGVEIHMRFLLNVYFQTCLSYYTEHQKKLITSSGQRSLKSTLSKLIIFGHK